MYKAKNYQSLWEITSVSNVLMKNHIKLYKGYVENTNAILNELRQKDEDLICRQSMKMRLGWEFSGMRLHEYFFANLGKEAMIQTGELVDWLNHCFGSFNDWQEDFIETAMTRGNGWAVLCRDNHTGNLMNIWIQGHATGTLIGCQPLLVIDAWEHAYMIDYGLDRRNYLERIMNEINWSVVLDRFSKMGI